MNEYEVLVKLLDNYPTGVGGGRRVHALMKPMVEKGYAVVYEAGYVITQDGRKRIKEIENEVPDDNPFNDDDPPPRDWGDL